MSELKACTKCGELKPPTKEYFYSHKSTKDGLNTYCKHCQGLLHKEWKKNNPDKVKLNRIKYNSKPRTKIVMKIANQRNWSAEKQRKYRKIKRQNDPIFKLRQNLRTRVSNAVKKCNSTKSDKSLKLIGCSISFLKEHLEYKFIEGMTWENYGKWHVDHIKPCALFDLSKKEQQLECFNYKNLQPLWAYDNLCKSDKYIENIY